MKVSKVYYQRNFRIGDFQYETIGVEIDINDGEDAHLAMEEAKRLVIAYNAEQNHPTPHIVERPIHDIELPVIEVEKEYGNTLEEQINSCTEFKVLETYYLICQNNPTLKSIYNIKKAELTKKEVKQILDATEALCKK